MDGITAPAHRVVGHSGSLSTSSPPLLVGRERERAILRAELAASGERGRLVLVGGEAGIGKTTLARELARDADALGRGVLTGSCYDLSNTPPYGPWLDLFLRYPQDASPPPPAIFAGGRLEAVTDQAALFAEVRRFLAALSAAGPTVLLLEDLHWADPASVDLLRYLGPHLRQWPVLVLVTYRADELTPRHPFAKQLPAMVREADGQRLDLRRLDADGLRALVSARYALAHPAEDRLVAYLERHAEGNPFFATELLRTLETDALLRQDGDVWTLAPLDRIVMPPLLRQVIDGRVIRLGEATRTPLALAAVIGQEVSLALWAAVAGLDDETLLTIVEQAVDAHLLDADRDGTGVRFIHALTREALYEGILPPRRRAWHGQVAEALLASANPDPDAVAYHLQAAGDPRAWEWLVQAGDRAQQAYAWLTAAERLRAAIALLAGVEGEARTRTRLLHRIAFLERFSDPASAIASCMEAEHLATQTGNVALAAEAHHLCGLLLLYADRSRDGRAMMTEAYEVLEAMSLDVAEVLALTWSWLTSAFAGPPSHPSPDDERAIARLHAAGLTSRRSNAVWVEALTGQPGEAAAAGERLLAVLAVSPGTTAGIRFVSVFAQHGLAIAYAAMGRPDDARRASAIARADFRHLGHHVIIAFSLCIELWDVIYLFGPPDPAVRRNYAAEAEAALARAGGALGPSVSPRLAWLSCFVLDGRWEEALAILRDLPTPRNSCLRREVSGPHATLARHRGDPETAWARIRPLFPDGPETEPGDLIHQEGLFLQRLAAGLCLDAGDLPTAHRWLDAHDRWLAWSGSVLGRAAGRLAWARYHWANGDTTRAREAANAALNLAYDPRQFLVYLATYRLLGELDTAAGDHAAAESHLTTALDLATEGELPFERALTLLALAELRLAAGRQEEAATHLNEVRRICTPLGARPTLARADDLSARLAVTSAVETHPMGLTRREVEVLRLLAQHYANAEIAAMLFVSTRTVETHVEHILAKLGVRTRVEAAEVAARLGLV